jgi:2-phosphoglycerate kinase
MAKTIVIKHPEGDRAPFLRGILVQSLVQKGLSFDDAYSLAQSVRDELRDTDEISSEELHLRVAELLERRFGLQIRQAYDAKPTESKEIIVKTTTRSAPFSVGILSHCLEACAIRPDVALDGARRVHEAIKSTGHEQISHLALRRIIYECLMLHGEEKGAQRYLSWRQFQNSSEPLILLIGGVSGVGKSTVTAEVAYRMNIVRTQSTDIMREIIRNYLAPHVVPTLGYSSFEAWRGLPTVRRTGRRKVDNPVIAGFLTQLSKVKVAIEATINQAVDEARPVIVDGVLVLPWELDLQELNKRAIVVPIMLAVMRKKLLAKHLKSRGQKQKARKASRYLERLDDIWELQSYLLSQADQAGIPIIPNWSIESTVHEVLELISQKIMARYPPNPRAMTRLV